MLKLLYKPTGNIFTLPDAEAIRIKQADRGNDYKILDCGNIKETEGTLASDKIKEIEAKEAEALEEEQKEFIEAQSDEAELPKVNPNFKKFEIDKDYKNMTKKELAVIAEKITGKYVDPTKLNKADIINLIEGKNN